MKQMNGYFAQNPSFSAISNAFAVLDSYPIEHYFKQLHSATMFLRPKEGANQTVISEYQEIVAMLDSISKLLSPLSARNLDNSLHYLGREINVEITYFIQQALPHTLESNLSAIRAIKSHTLSMLSTENLHDYILINLALDRIHVFLEYLYKG